MSVQYIVVPFEADGKLLSWLERVGVEPPANALSRYPSPQELRAVLDGLNDCTTEYQVVGDFWRAMVYETASADPGPPLRVEGPNVDIHVVDFQGNERLPHEFHFENGWPILAVTILARLARVTGPLVLSTESGENPVVIQAEDDVQQIMKAWNRTAD
jgi:hypothetical protein